MTQQSALQAMINYQHSIFTIPLLNIFSDQLFLLCTGYGL